MRAVVRKRAGWVTYVVGKLQDSVTCPICGATLGVQTCPNCGADYRELGQELWDASQAAIRALEARQSVLDRVVLRDIEPQQAPLPATAAVARPAAAPVVDAAPARSSATVQSVLAVAGAGLLAIAAIVFTFFNPDLADPMARGWIVAAVTGIFIAGAWVLARRRLQFSAEAVGALGLVFLALDINALTALVPSDPWAVAAVATAVSAVLMGWCALRARVRVWLTGSLVALSVVPAMIGYASGAAVMGHLGAAVAAFGLLAATSVLARRWGAPLRGERAVLTIVELAAIALAIVDGALSEWLWSAPSALALCATLTASAVLALVSTRHSAPGMWSFLSGFIGVAAAAILPWSLWPADAPVSAAIGAVPAAAVAGAIVWALVVPAPRGFVRSLAGGGGSAVVGLSVIPAALTALTLGTSTLAGEGDITPTDLAVAAVAGLAAVGAGLGLFAVLERRLRDRTVLGARWPAAVGVWFSVAAAATLICVPAIAPWARVAIGLGLAAVLALAAAFFPPVRDRSAAVRIPVITGAHALVAVAAVVSWRAGAELAAVAGAAVVVSIAFVALTMPRHVRFVYVGAGYAYALVVLATAMSLAGITGVALLCLVTSVAAIGAIVATFAAAVGPRSWYAILAVTSVPFLLGVAQVIFERSGWTALSTSLIFALALTLVVTRRSGLGAPLRITAATVLVPSLAVVAVCLGAQLLPSSGSPVVLPVIALIAAVVLPGGPAIRAGLEPRIGVRDAALVRVAIEASTLLTASIAVALAVVREAAGLSTTLIVLVVLGMGGVATAVRGGRKYGWWLAGAAFTGALWCALGLAGVGFVEPYLLPPALGAAAIGAVLTIRGLPAVRLFAAGLLAAVGPLLVLLALEGAQPRAMAILGAALGLVIIGTLFRRGGWAALAAVTFAVAVLAASAGAVEGVRLGTDRDTALIAAPDIVGCLAFGVAAAAVAATAARGLRASAARDGSRLRRTGWLSAPAFAYAAVAAWTSIEADWAVIWTMWGLMASLLVALVAIAGRNVRGSTSLPPVWFVFALAFVTAVVAWSPRELRVEWFSLPLGAALLVAGVFGMSAAADDTSPGVPARRLADWPARWSGSWALLAPGIIVALSASVAASFTDPQTWRAILVIVLALVAILIGAARRLAAPFIIGIVVLPVENAIAFAVQIGRGIQSMPWWITLAVVGAVLLIIAVTYERRAGEHSGLAARLRDLA